MWFGLVELYDLHKKAVLDTNDSNFYFKDYQIA